MMSVKDGSRLAAIKPMLSPATSEGEQAKATPLFGRSYSLRARLSVFHLILSGNSGTHHTPDPPRGMALS